MLMILMTLLDLYQLIIYNNNIQSKINYFVLYYCLYNNNNNNNCLTHLIIHM